MSIAHDVAAAPRSSTANACGPLEQEHLVQSNGWAKISPSAEIVLRAFACSRPGHGTRMMKWFTPSGAEFVLHERFVADNETVLDGLLERLCERLRALRLPIATRGRIGPYGRVAVPREMHLQRVPEAAGSSRVGLSTRGPVAIEPAGKLTRNELGNAGRTHFPCIVETAGA
jgi:hypothetical protein